MKSTEHIIASFAKADEKSVEEIKETQKKELLKELKKNRGLSLNVPNLEIPEKPEFFNAVVSLEKEELAEYLKKNEQTIMEQIFPDKDVSYIFKTLVIEKEDKNHYFDNFNKLLHCALFNKNNSAAFIQCVEMFYHHQQSLPSIKQPEFFNIPVSRYENWLLDVLLNQENFFILKELILNSKDKPELMKCADEHLIFTAIKLSFVPVNLLAFFGNAVRLMIAYDFDSLTKLNNKMQTPVHYVIAHHVNENKGLEIAPWLDRYLGDVVTLNYKEHFETKDSFGKTGKDYWEEILNNIQNFVEYSQKYKLLPSLEVHEENITPEEIKESPITDEKAEEDQDSNIKGIQWN